MPPGRVVDHPKLGVLMGGKAARPAKESDAIPHKEAGTDPGLKVLRVPTKAHRRLKSIASDRGESLNDFVAWLLTENEVVSRELRRLSSEKG